MSAGLRGRKPSPVGRQKGVPHQQPLTGVFFFGVSKEVLAMGRALWREPLREGKGSEMMRGGLHRSMISLQGSRGGGPMGLKSKGLVFMKDYQYLSTGPTELCFLRHPGRAWTLEERIQATMNHRNGVYLSVLMGFVAINLACNLLNLPFEKAFKLSAASTEFYVCPE